MQKKGQTRNKFLIIGLTMVTTLLILAIFGNYLAPYKTGEEIPALEDETGKVISAPFSPSWSHLLGTDTAGVDLVSKIFRGAKYTLMVVVAVGFGRLLIAIPIGIIIGWWPKYFKKSFSYVNRVWTSIPLFLFVYIIIAPISAFYQTPYFQMFLLWLILTIAGLPPIIETVRGHVEEIKKYDFMEGVKVLGAKPFYIFRKHLFPHLKPQLTITLSMEMAQILWLLGQLGIFHIFLGGTIEKWEWETDTTFYYSNTNEWAGILGQSRKYILVAPWMPIAPALAFVYGILGFQFLSEGLRRGMNKNFSKFDL